MDLARLNAVVIGDGEPIVIPRICTEPREQVDYEGVANLATAAAESGGRQFVLVSSSALLSAFGPAIIGLLYYRRATWAGVLT